MSTKSLAVFVVLVALAGGLLYFGALVTTDPVADLVDPDANGTDIPDAIGIDTPDAGTDALEDNIISTQ